MLPVQNQKQQNVQIDTEEANKVDEADIQESIASEEPQEPNEVDIKTETPKENIVKQPKKRICK